jgi:ABC-type lipoprotein release transport system permease subunit
MNESIFRQKSIDRISSPEKIDDYMKITGISMWLVLGCILLLLAAAIIWGFTGRIEDRIVDSQGNVSVTEIAPITLLTKE